MKLPCALPCPALALLTQSRPAVSPRGGTGKLLLVEVRNGPQPLQGGSPRTACWAGAGHISHRPSLRSHRGRSSADRKPGPSLLPALASWKGKIRRKTGPCGEEAAAPRRAGGWADWDPNEDQPAAPALSFGYTCVTRRLGCTGKTGGSDPHAAP